VNEKIKTIMKGYHYIKHNPIFGMCSKTGENGLLRLFIMLLMVLLSFSGYAQFITLKLDIPPETAQTEIVPFEMYITTNKKTGQQTLHGKTVLCISGAENFFVLPTLSHSDSLRNDTGHAFPFSESLTYRNDGNSNPPGLDANHQKSFPLSNSGRIIENITTSPQVLNTFIFIHAMVKLPKNKRFNYVGFINFKIEYN